MSMNRRLFLKGGVAASALGVVAGAGLLTPRAVLAAWPKAAFDAESVEGALEGVYGASGTTDSGDIKIKAPDIAENGAVVPITVSTGMSGVESITIMSAENENPMAAAFDLSGRTEAYVSTRIKMAQTSDVVAVVKAGGKMHKAAKNVKVTIGGCGG